MESSSGEVLLFLWCIFMVREYIHSKNVPRLLGGIWAGEWQESDPFLKAANLSKVTIDPLTNKSI